ncbi:polysaccharide deacetylase family protein [Balneola sp. MJW-20]|uniref:polysaccharide deacetylase family protein n=1 Tax=Gracilimonas aurantiaca TaxID=3234185 RepID=UPI0034668199
MANFEEKLTLQADSISEYLNAGKVDKRLQDIKVLMYHRILSENEYDNKHWTGVHVNHFEEHLKVLELFGFTPITFTDLRFFLTKDLELPRKPVIITFDDGYKDYYDLAHPLLMQYGMRAVVFAIGDRKIRENIWDDENIIERAPLMTDEELISIFDDGVEIGAHSYSHKPLTKITPAELEAEIFECKDSLEELLETDIHTFCYPYGLDNEEVQSVVKKSGFTFGCSVYNGPLQFGDSLFCIHRVTIKNGMGALGFALRILTPYEYLELGGSKVKKMIKNLINT